MADITPKPLSSWAKYTHNLRQAVTNPMEYIGPKTTAKNKEIKAQDAKLVAEQKGEGSASQQDKSSLDIIQTTARDDINVYGRANLLEATGGSLAIVAGTVATVFGYLGYAFGSLFSTKLKEASKKLIDNGMGLLGRGFFLAGSAVYGLIATPIITLYHKITNKNSLDKIITKEGRDANKTADATDKKPKVQEAVVSQVTSSLANAKAPTLENKKAVATRKILVKPIGEIIRNFAAISEEQGNKIAAFQAKLVAIHKYEEAEKVPDKTNLYKISSVEEADAVIAANNIGKKFLSEGRKITDSNQGVPRDVPLFGDLAVKMGIVTNDVKNALLRAQAAERIVSAQEGHFDKTIGEFFTATQSNNTDKATEYLSEKMFSRPFISDKEGIQAIQHLTDIVAGFNAAYKPKPEEVQKTNAAIFFLGKHCYNEAAKNMATLTANPQNNISTEEYSITDVITSLDDIGQEKFVQQMKLLDFSKALNIVKSAANTAVEAIKSKTEHPELAEHLSKIVEERSAQAEKLTPEKGKTAQIEMS